MAGGATITRQRPKEFHFPVTVEWIGGRRVSAHAAGKEAVEATPPPVFNGTDPTAWTPEDFFVAAAASCLAITFTGLAVRSGLDYTALSVDADGIAGARPDGHFGFTRVVMTITIEADDVEQARRLAQRAEEACLVSASLDLPVALKIEVGPPTRP